MRPPFQAARLRGVLAIPAILPAHEDPDWLYWKVRKEMMPVVIVADADPEFTALLRVYLGADGYTVDSASQGLDCLRRVRRLLPDILVLDRELPWGGGDGVVAVVREDMPDYRPSVVIMTDDDQPLQPIAAPVVACLRKPFTLAELVTILSAAVEPRRGDANARRHSGSRAGQAADTDGTMGSNGEPIEGVESSFGRSPAPVKTRPYISEPFDFAEQPTFFPGCEAKG